MYYFFSTKYTSDKCYINFGDDMKKTVIKGIVFIILGFIIGNIIFGNLKNYLKRMKNIDTYYFLQEGVYTNKESLQANLKNLTERTITKEKEKYYVYVGITKDKEVAEMIMSIYEKQGYKIYLKEKDIDSTEFSENVNQYDLLIKDAESEEQVLTIEQVVLANYEEIIKKQ